MLNIMKNIWEENNIKSMEQERLKFDVWILLNLYRTLFLKYFEKQFKHDFEKHR
jgi:hypothetical protein